MKATAFGLSLLAAVCAAAAQAQIVTDGSVGAKVDLPGLHVEIPDTLGTPKGANLFHSFEKFNIGSKGSATFTQTRAESINNVISRVTGGEVSSIDGELISEVGNADFWFINPAGVMFGPNASINVPAAFHLSTAERIGFVGGEEYFSALDTEGSTLSVAAPESFGFLGQSGSIAVQDLSGSDFFFPNDDVSLVGGKITITNSTISPLHQGQIRLVSVATGDVTLTETGADVSSVASFGDIEVSKSKLIGPGAGNGRVFIRGHHLAVENESKIEGRNTGIADNTQRGVDITLTGSLEMSNSVLESSAWSTGKGGDLHVKAERITLDNGTRVETGTITGAEAGSIVFEAEKVNLVGSSSVVTNTGDEGDAGDIRITASEAINVNGWGTNISSSSTVFFADGGDAGDVRLTAPIVSVADGAFVSSNTFVDGGDGGAIFVEANMFSLQRGGWFAAGTAGTGAGGQVVITANDSVSISGVDDTSGSLSNISTSSFNLLPFVATGDAGRIRIEASEVKVTNDGLVASDTDGFGMGGEIEIVADRVEVLSSGHIQASTNGPADAGNVVVTARDALVLSGPSSQISANSLFFASGDGGRILVEAPSIEIADGASVSSGTGGAGEGGTVTVKAATLVLTGGGSVDASTLGTGNGGDVVIQAVEQIDISGGRSIVVDGEVGVVPSGLFNISSGTGAAGNIAVSGPKELSLSEATISTQAFGADGGSIDIQVQDLIHLKNSDITTQVVGLKGDAGNIFIDPQFVVLNNSRIVARAVGGNGGNIKIVADNLIMDPQSIIDATSQLGVSGTVSLSDPETDVESALMVAEPEFLDPSSLLAETCTQRSGQTRSSLVRGSRGGLPEDPGRMLHATLIADQLPEDFETEGANGPKDSSLAIFDVESFATRAGIQMLACR